MPRLRIRAVSLDGISPHCGIRYIETLIIRKEVVGELSPVLGKESLCQVGNCTVSNIAPAGDWLVYREEEKA
jgi:hypothetical protein